MMFAFLTRITALSVLLFPGLGAVARRHYDIVNNCPSSIEYFINGNSQGDLASGATASHDLLSDFSGYIYTAANGGNLEDGTHFSRAVFRGTLNYYYILVDPGFLNVGIKITPINKTSALGFCPPIQCTTAACSAFSLDENPTTFPTPVPGVPPKAPLYECPDENTGYTVTFCPDGKFPRNEPNPGALHPHADSSKCLDVRGAKFENGTPVQIYDCNDTAAQQWVLRRGSTKVKVEGTNFCLDAGSTPGNGVGMKIWQCYDNLPAQQWYYTNDNRLALEGQGLCLDLTNGVTVNSNQVQTWKCTDGNTNQIWYW